MNKKCSMYLHRIIYVPHTEMCCDMHDVLLVYGPVLYTPIDGTMLTAAEAEEDAMTNEDGSRGIQQYIINDEPLLNTSPMMNWCWLLLDDDCHGFIETSDARPWWVTACVGGRWLMSDYAPMVCLMIIHPLSSIIELATPDHTGGTTTRQ